MRALAVVVLGVVLLAVLAILQAVADSAVVSALAGVFLFVAFGGVGYLLWKAKRTGRSAAWIFRHLG